jgi:hypothetical protein
MGYQQMTKGADEGRRQLYHHLEAGMPFGEVEDWIDGLPASEDAKAGLWLLAWAEQERPAQRRIAGQALAAVDS